MSDNSSKWSLISHLDHGGAGALSLIRSDNMSISNLTSETASGSEYAPWFLGLTDEAKIILFDPVSKVVSLADKMPKDAYPAYCYKDTFSNRVWFMNDGDAETGADPLNCGNEGSTVTIIDRGNGIEAPAHIATLCVGRGHHVTTFVGPSDRNPSQTKLAFVSNLLSGTISVINNDDNDKKNFLSIIHTIDLTESDKEKDGTSKAPNNAFPHGKQYSSVTDRIYSLNNGYGTIAVINPSTFDIESHIDLKGASNLLLSPCGKYLIGKGADRKSDAEHVVGKINVVDIQKQEIINAQDIPDFYPSVYRFSPDGSKLFVTSAATGKGVQKENLKINTLYVYDATQLPELPLLKIIETGEADCGRRPLAFPADARIKLLFNPNPTEGTLNIIDTETLEISKTLTIADNGGQEFNFALWENSIYGA